MKRWVIAGSKRIWKIISSRISIIRIRCSAVWTRTQYKKLSQVGAFRRNLLWSGALFPSLETRLFFTERDCVWLAAIWLVEKTRETPQPCQPITFKTKTNHDFRLDHVCFPAPQTVCLVFFEFSLAPGDRSLSSHKCYEHFGFGFKILNRNYARHSFLFFAQFYEDRLHQNSW